MCATWISPLWCATKGIRMPVATSYREPRKSGDNLSISVIVSPKLDLFAIAIVAVTQTHHWPCGRGGASFPQNTLKYSRILPKKTQQEPMAPPLSIRCSGSQPVFHTKRPQKDPKKNPWLRPWPCVLSCSPSTWNTSRVSPKSKLRHKFELVFIIIKAVLLY
jgi:hypothetical protein